MKVSHKTGFFSLWWLPVRGVLRSYAFALFTLACLLSVSQSAWADGFPSCLAPPEPADEEPDPQWTEPYTISPGTGGFGAGAGFESGGQTVDVMSGHVFIKFKPSTTQEQKCELYNRWNFIWVFEYGIINGYDFNSAFAVFGQKITVAEAINQLMQEPIVALAEPNFVVKPDLAPNDPCFPGSYGCPLEPQWYWTRVHAAEGWDVTTGLPHGVSVVDSGFDLTHPEFVNHISPEGISGVLVKRKKCILFICWTRWVPDVRIGPTVPPYNYGSWQCPDFAPSYCPAFQSPINSHGSEVGGIIGAKTNNEVGIAGGDWTIYLIPGRSAAVWCNFPGLGNGYYCFDWATITWIFYHLSTYPNFSCCHRTLNMSWSGPAGQYMWDWMNYFYNYSWTLPVAAAGNNNTSNKEFPAGFNDVVLSVGALDKNDCRAAFSNYGNWVEASAPGVSMTTLAVGGYITASGTSFATPVVSALAHLLRSKNHGWLPSQIENKILATSDPLYDEDPCEPPWLPRGSVRYDKALQ